MEEKGIDKELVGFSNSRMAYDDVLSRVAVTVERNTLAEKLTSGDLIKAYRSEEKLNDRTVMWMRRAIEELSKARPKVVGAVQFNKATLYSWVLFVIKASAIFENIFSNDLLGRYIKNFESDRGMASLGVLEVMSSDLEFSGSEFHKKIYSIYDDRASARVADVSSVVLRDVAIWIEFERFLRETSAFKINTEKAGLKKLHQVILGIGWPIDDDVFARAVLEVGWGRIL